MITIPIQEAFDSLEKILKPILIQEFDSIRNNLKYTFKISLADTNGNQIYSGVSSGIVCCDNCYSSRHKFCGYRHQFNAAERSVETTAKRVISNETKKKEVKIW